MRLGGIDYDESALTSLCDMMQSHPGWPILARHMASQIERTADRALGGTLDDREMIRCSGEYITYKGVLMLPDEFRDMLCAVRAANEASAKSR